MHDLPIVSGGTPVRVKLTIDRAAAILAGRATYGAVIVAVNPADLISDPIRQELAKVKTYGSAQDEYHDLTAYPVPMADINGVHAALAEHCLARQKEEARRAEAKEKEGRDNAGKIQAWLDTPREELIVCGNDGWRVELPDISAYYDGQTWGREDRMKHLRQAGHGARLDNLLAEAKTRNDKAAAERKATEARVKEQREAAERRKAEQLAAWVRDHGTEGQKERFAAKLLGQEEILDGMRALAFAPLDHVARFERIKDQEVRDAAGASEDYDVEYETDDAYTCTDAEFAALKAIRTVMSLNPDSDVALGAEVKLRIHRGRVAGNDEWDVERKSARVEVTVGEFKFRREYALA